MKKSVVLILAVSTIVSIGTLAYAIFSGKPEVAEATKVEVKAEKIQPSTEGITGSVFPKPKKVIPSPSPSKSTQVVSPKREDVPFLLDQVLTQEEMRLMIEKFGKPTKEALRWIMKDSRYAEFLALLEETFDKDLSEEAKEAIMEGMRLMWYQQDMLNQVYSSDLSLSMDAYELGLREIMRTNKGVLERALSDEQYMKLTGESKTDRSFEPEGTPVSSEGFEEMKSLFPALRNNERAEVSSATDVYKVVPKEAVDSVRRISREQLRFEQELNRMFLAGDIQKNDFESESSRIQKEASNRIDEVLTPEQELFLYGASRRWDAMMPEKGKEGEDES